MNELVPAQEQALTLKERRDLLPPRERLAYDALVAQPSSRPPLSPSVMLQLYQLFLVGKSCEEIASLNPALTTLADVVRARVEDRWDERRQAYRDSLLTGAQDKLIQLKLESVGFWTEQLSAVHRRFGREIQKYLMTGDEKFLSGLMVHSPKQYKEVVEMIKALTGQDQEQVRVSGTVQHEHKVSAGATSGPPTKGPLTPEQAAQILKALTPPEEK